VCDVTLRALFIDAAGILALFAVALVAASAWLQREERRGRPDRQTRAWMAMLDDEAELFFVGEGKGQMARHASCDLPPVAFFRKQAALPARRAPRPSRFAGLPAETFRRELDRLLA
jgi:cbb3-type cytochrome oxidase subunit 3